MVVIKSLGLRSFKSFVKKTEIPFGERFNIVLGPNGSGKSSRYDTEVLLDSGEIKQIGRLVDDALKDSKVHIQLDDGVYTPENPQNIKTWGLDPKSMKVVKKDISTFIKREGEPYLYEITTRTGKSVTTTGCHPVMVFKGDEVKSEIVKNLSTRNFIATPNKLIFPSKKVKLPKADYSFERDESLILRNKIRLPLFLNEDFSRFLGYLVGDGCMIKDVRCDFINADKELIDDFMGISRKFGCTVSLYNYKSRGKASLVSVYSKVLTNYLISKLFKRDYKKEKKHIPSILMFAEERILANFLAALFDCDASIRKAIPTFEYVTMSKKLANQVQLALLRFGIVAKKQAKLKYAANTQLKKRKLYYYVTVYGKEQLEKLYKGIPFKCIHKSERLAFIVNKKLKPNPNLDLLPKETNNLIRECTKLLHTGYKPLRKKYPKFAAYNENRCCPTKEGLKEALSIFNTKRELIKKCYAKLRLDQGSLMATLREIGLSPVKAADHIGVTRHTITDVWEKGIFNAKPENLKRLYKFIKNEVTEILEKTAPLLEVLENLSNSDIFWDQITSINKVKGEPYVYDLTIPNCHNFIGNGIFVHNSNICDALCFVLGRGSSHDLRAEKSANLIYNGGKKGDPAKDAEVSICFDNSKKEFPLDTPEIAISRRVKQSGISTYRINGEVRTRQQVLDLLKAAKIDPEGHNIILQGDIVQFTEMKPTDRRLLIEDIAGISAYEEKKEKSMHELEKVQARLNEADIILTEREKTLSDLKKDRDQALTYKDLEKNVERNKATALSLEIKRKEEKIGETEAVLQKQEEAIKKIEEEISRLQKGIEENNNEIKKIAQELEEKGDKKQKEITRSIDEIKTEIIKKETRSNVCENEIRKIRDRKGQLKKSVDEANSELGQFEEKRKGLVSNGELIKEKQKKLEGDIKAHKEKHGLKDLGDYNTKIDEAEKEIEAKSQAKNGMLEEKQKIFREKDQLDLVLKSIEKGLEEFSKLKREDAEKFAKLKDARKEFKDVAKDLSKSLNESSVFSVQLGNARNALFDGKEELAKLNAKSLGMKEVLAADVAVSKIKESGIKDVYGIVKELGEVNSKYSLALEVAAGQRINSVVVTSDVVATKCIDFLKETKSGVLTFLPLNKMREKAMPEEVKNFLKESGVIGMATDLVKYDSKFKTVFNYVFGSTIVVESLIIARKLGIGRARMVTLEGDLVEPSGAMIGGFRRKTGLGFKEKEVSDRIGYLDKNIKELEIRVQDLEKKKLEVEERAISLRERKAVLEAEISLLEKSAGVSTDKEDLAKSRKEVEEKIRVLDQRLVNVDKAVAKEDNSIGSLKKFKGELWEKISSLNKPEVTSQLAQLEEEREKVREEYLANNSELQNLQNRREMHQKEIEKIQNIIKDTDKERDSFIKEIEEIKAQMKDMRNSLKANEDQQKSFYKEYEALYKKREKCKDSIQKIEKEIVMYEERSKGALQRKNDTSIRKAVLAGELEGLKKAFEPFKDVQLRRGILLEDLNAEIKSFEQQMKAMGGVNLRALEIYEKVSEEYKHLLEKYDKLKQEKEDILNMMYEVESKKKDEFMKTFKNVTKNFKEIFSTLSNKGEAELVIENEENPFGGGITIEVRIANKKFLDIRSLSGGEKTMAALAFIFAIQDYSPAAFYFLDEVDAALDKKNSELLTQLIQKYSGAAQYIVISHNDHVISEAENIYGVSMQDGVSKIFSLKV